ncbi:MAG: acyltransferase [Candidatus Accumulibacter sp.]|nr:acyltransferase [Accumulibacter sp.]
MGFIMTSTFHPPPPLHDHSHPNYRPDIDGLRAVAVLAVVAYHFFPDWVKGGFVGVDVFFVISGFLIGGILLDSLQEGTFSLRAFYARRVRRIFPALLVVMAASLAFGWFALLPNDYWFLGKHTAGGAGFISNLLFWREAGYFDVAAERKPLLHLWSLGVEEQFYIFFPLFLWGLWKKNLRLATFLALLTWASYRWNLVTYRKASAFDFYLPMTRFWELLAGVLLALWERNRHERIRIVSVFFRDAQTARAQGGAFRSFVSLIGALLFIVALVKTQTVKFPGKQALIPVLGAVCLIAAGPKAWVNRTLLSLKPVVWVGLISYPLYLWHWPLLSYVRIILGGMPDRVLCIGMILLAILLAALTYWIVERPVRFGKRWRKAKVSLLCILMFILALCGVGVRYKNGYEDRWIVRETKFEPVMRELRERFPEGITQTDHAAFKARYGQPDSLPKYYPWMAALPNSFTKYYSWTAVFRDVKGKHTTVIIGDSHAHFAYFAIADYNAKIGINTAYMGETWRFYKENNSSYMDGLKDFYINAIKNDPSIDKIFVLTYQRRVDLKQEDIDALQRPGLKIYWVADNPLIMDEGKLDNNSLQEQLGRFLKIRHPLFPSFLENKEEEDSSTYPFLHRSRAEAFKGYQKHLDVLYSKKGVTVIEGAFDAFCAKDPCPFFDENGQPLYVDNNHITSRTGGKRLVDKVLKPYL